MLPESASEPLLHLLRPKAKRKGGGKNECLDELRGKPKAACTPFSPLLPYSGSQDQRCSHMFPQGRYSRRAVRKCKIQPPISKLNLGNTTTTPFFMPPQAQSSHNAPLQYTQTHPATPSPWPSAVKHRDMEGSILWPPHPQSTPPKPQRQPHAPPQPTQEVLSGTNPVSQFTALSHSLLEGPISSSSVNIGSLSLPSPFFVLET